MKESELIYLQDIFRLENIIKESKKEYTVKEYYKKFCKKGTYKTTDIFEIMVNYLIQSKKVMMEKDKVIWIFDTKLDNQHEVEPK